MTHKPWIFVNGIPVDEEITHIFLDSGTYDQFIKLWHVVETDNGPRWKPNPEALGVWCLEQFPDVVMPIMEELIPNMIPIHKFGDETPCAWINEDTGGITRFTYDGTQEDHGDVTTPR